MISRFLFLVSIALWASATSVHAQIPADPVLVADPERDLFDFADRYYRRGEQARDQGQKQLYFNQAAEHFGSFVQNFPRSKKIADARYRLGTAYLYTGRPDQAASQFRAVLSIAPRGRPSALAAYRLATIRYQKRDFAGAAPYFARSADAAVNDSQRQSSRYFEATSYTLAKNNRKAKQALEKLVNDPGKERNIYYARGKLQLGLILQGEGSFEQALNHFVPLLKKNIPAKIRGEALVNAGACCTELGQLEQADIYLEAVLAASEYRDHHESAQTSLMLSAFKAKDMPRVLKIYERRPVGSSGKNAAQLHLLAGRAYFLKKNYTIAKIAFRRSEQAFPKSELAFEAAYRRLICFYNTESKALVSLVDSFLQLYARKNAGSPRIQTARLMKAETLFEKKRYTEAATVYNTINTRLIDEKNRAGLLHHKGWCLAESGDSNGAIQSFSEFIASYPQDIRIPKTIARRGQSYMEAGNVSQALKDFDRIIQADPTSDLAALCLQQSADLQRKQNNYKDMVQRYSQLLDQHDKLSDTTKAHATYWIGYALFKEDKYIAAAERFNTARTLDSKNFNDQSGSYMVLCYYMAKDVDGLLSAVERVRKDVPGKDLPPRTLTWLGIKSFERRDFRNAVVYLTLVADPLTPENTSAYIWKHLSKASIETANYKGALKAISHVLDQEENSIARADAFLDKGLALLGLGKHADAIEMAEAGLELQRQGKLHAELQLLLGDIAYARKNYEEAVKKYVVTAELFLDNTITPIALFKASRTFQVLGRAAEKEEYQNRLQKDFPDFQLTQRWIGGPQPQ